MQEEIVNALSSPTGLASYQGWPGIATFPARWVSGHPGGGRWPCPQDQGQLSCLRLFPRRRNGGNGDAKSIVHSAAGYPESTGDLAGRNMVMRSEDQNAPGESIHFTYRAKGSG